MMRLVQTLLLGIAFLSPGLVFAQNEAYFLLSADQIKCLAKNMDSYLSSSEGTMFIKSSECGTERTGKTISFMEMTLNAAPDIEIVEDRGVPDEIVVLTREDLSCIARQTLPETANLVAFYPEGCRLVVREP
jgi:hypothetical protein